MIFINVIYLDLWGKKNSGSEQNICWITFAAVYSNITFSKPICLIWYLGYIINYMDIKNIIDFDFMRFYMCHIFIYVFIKIDIQEHPRKTKAKTQLGTRGTAENLWLTCILCGLTGSMKKIFRTNSLFHNFCGRQFDDDLDEEDQEDAEAVAAEERWAKDQFLRPAAQPEVWMHRNVCIWTDRIYKPGYSRYFIW